MIRRFCFAFFFFALAGAWAAQPLPDGAVLWLKADAGVTADDSGKVSTWEDQSGNGLNAVQPIPDYQPEFHSDGMSSLPSLRFHGENILDTSAFHLPNTFSVFLVSQIATGRYTQLLSYAKANLNTAAASGGFHIYSSTAPPENAGKYIRIVSLFPSKELSIAGETNWLGGNEPKIAELHADGEGTTSVFANGVGMGSSTESFGTLPVHPLHIGAKSGVSGPELGLNGYISEILIYDRVLSEAERRQVLQYLAEKYQITVEAEPPLGAH